MLIRTVVAPLLGTNCYVLSDGYGRCAVVDPGAGVVDDVLRLVRGEALRPVAVLATHGHVDHTWSAADLCDALDVPFHLHADDAYRVADPFGTLGPLGAQLAAMGESAGMTYREPRDVQPFATDGAGPVDLVLGAPAGDEPPFALRAVHAPGHTEGSTIYVLDPEVDGHRGPTALTGDVLFAGTIGRTDLPGGDGTLMARTLRWVATLDPTTHVLPGHGPASRIATELLVNPYLRTSR